MLLKKHVDLPPLSRLVLPMIYSFLHKVLAYLRGIVVDRLSQAPFSLLRNLARLMSEINNYELLINFMIFAFRNMFVYINRMKNNNCQIIGGIYLLHLVKGLNLYCNGPTMQNKVLFLSVKWIRWLEESACTSVQVEYITRQRIWFDANIEKQECKSDYWISIVL